MAHEFSGEGSSVHVHKAEEQQRALEQQRRVEDVDERPPSARFIARSHVAHLRNGMHSEPEAHAAVAICQENARVPCWEWRARARARVRTQRGDARVARAPGSVVAMCVAAASHSFCGRPTSRPVAFIGMQENGRRGPNHSRGRRRGGQKMVFSRHCSNCELGPVQCGFPKHHVSYLHFFPKCK